MCEDASRVRRPRSGRERESGFALILAILALMLLTFLGLTLATTTSTELQIATNYRWSLQALANAEAGIEAAKIILRDSGGGNWVGVLPTDRTTAVTWTATTGTSAPTPGNVTAGVDSWGNPLRQLENAGCDARGGAVGYGAVLAGIQDRTTLFGQALNGAVTIWIRRGYTQNMDGTFRDDGSNGAAVITAEGVAPFTGSNVAMNFALANRAVRVLEASYLSQVGNASACTSYGAQGGGGVSGSGFWGCGTTPDLGSATAAGGVLAAGGGAGGAIAGVR